MLLRSRGLFLLLVWTLFLTLLASDVDGAPTKPAATKNGVGKTDCERKFEDGRYAEALPACQTSLSVAESNYGSPHPAVADALRDVGIVLNYLGKSTEAEGFCLRSLEMSRHLFGEDHDSTARAWMCLGSIAASQSKSEKASNAYASALKVRRKIFGNNHKLTIDSIVGFASSLSDRGLYQQAEIAFTEAITISKSALRSDSDELAILMNDMAVFYRKIGKYAMAKNLLEQALEIRKSTIGIDHPETATTMHNLANVLELSGDYIRSEKLSQAALGIQIKQLGAEHPDVATGMSNHAITLSRHGEYEQAEMLHRQALEIRRKTLGIEHSNYAESLNNLAVILEKEKKCTESESLNREALAIRRKSLRAEHPLINASLNNLASSISCQGRFLEAEAILLQALKMQKEQLGPEHPEVAVSLHNLATSLFNRRDFEKSLSLHNEGLALRKRVFGDDHPKVADSLRNLVSQFYANGDTENAIRTMNSMLRIREIQIRSITSEARTQAILQKIREDEDILYSILMESPTRTDIAELALSTALLRQGRTIEAGTIANKFLLAHGRDPLTQKKLEAWLSIRQQRDALLYAGLGQLSPAQYVDRINALSLSSNSIESDLAKDMPEIAELYPPNYDKIIKKIAGKLPQNGALISFLWFKPFQKKFQHAGEKWGKPRYLALILLADQKVIVVDLGLASEIDSTSQLLLAALRTPTCSPVKPSHELYKRIFLPLRPYLDNISEVYISPDGALNLIPFDALHDGDNYLLGRQRFHYLTSGRDLLREPSIRTTQPPLILANPDWGQWDAQQNDDKQALLQHLPALTPLPGSQREAEQIGRLLGVTPRIGTAATEDLLRSQHAPQILHLATHGLVMDVVGSPAGARSSLLVPAPTVEAEEKQASAFMWQPGAAGSMNRSALVLAGVLNGHRGTGLPSAADGLLTADEVRSLNLEGTQLVVLSACDTGRGEVRAGQGVYGLRRAFLIAGAETLVTSLWRIHDEATGELMTTYYRKLLDKQKPGDRLGAMTEAMAELRSRPGRSHPYYWAPFLVIGQGGPLRPGAVPN